MELDSTGGGAGLLVSVVEGMCFAGDVGTEVHLIFISTENLGKRVHSFL